MQYSQPNEASGLTKGKFIRQNKSDRSKRTHIIKLQEDPVRLSQHFKFRIKGICDGVG